MSDVKVIWDFLTGAGLTPQGAAGLMGNLQAESGLIANRVEILCLNRYRQIGKVYTDASYTEAVDNGTISEAEFLRPMAKQYGYGLAQWTSPSRKHRLYDYCKKAGVSIGDLNAQLEFLISELATDYKSVLNTLISTKDIMVASNAVLMKFEMPADQSAYVQSIRYSYGKAIYDEMMASSSDTNVTAEDIIGIMDSWVGFSESNGKYKQIIDIYNAYGEKYGYPRGYRVPYGVAWCDTTISAAFIKAGAVSLIGNVECGVEEHIKIFKAKGIWIENGNIIPKPGYIITYNWDDVTQPNDGYADHIGIVESISHGASGNIITVIEGNYGNAVRKRHIPVGWGYIRGYAAPKYAEGSIADKPVEKPEPEQQSADTELSKEPQWVSRVTADYLNVRTWAGTEYPNIKSYPVLAYGNLVDVCDKVTAKNGKPWYYIRIAGKYYGFVSSAYIQAV